MSTITRNIKDAALQVATSLPAQNTNNNTNSLYIGSGVPDDIVLEISVPATPALANGQTLTFTIQDSADNATFAAVAPLATLVLTGAGGAGAAAQTYRVYLPPTVRQYVRVNQAASATAGDSTAVKSTISLVF